MATSVENRQFRHQQVGPINGVISRPPPRPLHQNDVVYSKPSPLLQKPPSDEYSDDDEDDDVLYLADAVKRSTVDLEASIHDPRDDATSDNWISRNPAMIRLTGKHPFNSEPPLNRLMHCGFITPVPLHYVRNHGAVPRAAWEDWSIEVTGLVTKPRTFTMDELVNEFPHREFPATLVCAGNRRKEQNMVKKSIGFNWGAAGTSTSIWRGIPLPEILKKCGIMKRRRNGGGALHVCFEGSEDLPGGGGAKYGTSLKVEMAMDPARDIILAFMQNGEKLTPDHGFPVRVIIPGFIGGRMVKWLKRIIVTPQESDNYYHFNDNRVLPSHVDAELANAEGGRCWVTVAAGDEIGLNRINGGLIDFIFSYWVRDEIGLNGDENRFFFNGDEIGYELASNGAGEGGGRCWVAVAAGTRRWLQELGGRNQELGGGRNQGCWWSSESGTRRWLQELGGGRNQRCWWSSESGTRRWSKSRVLVVEGTRRWLLWSRRVGRRG